MAYHHEAYPFPMEHQPQANMYFPHAIEYVPYMQHHQPLQDMMFQPHPYSDYHDYIPMGMMPEDYDETSEVSTRPRLTKEQVEVLEAQFQAHPKPNSMVKKQLAIQTKLTLPRVANWFQNRRAKAKQQRKQEEFELAQNMGAADSWKDDCNEGMTETSSKTSSPVRQPSVSEERSKSVGSRSPAKLSESGREWRQASPQQCMGVAVSEPEPQAQLRAQDCMITATNMPPPEIPRYVNSAAKSQTILQRAQTSSLSPSSDWSQTQSINSLTSPTAPVTASIQDLGFDFGFNQDQASTSQSNTVDDSPEGSDQQYIVSADDWNNPYSARALSVSQPHDGMITAQTSPLSFPTYPESRRGSGADELTANLGTFAIAGTPPISVAHLHQMAVPIRPTDGEIDIASRRKRPRPAALTSAALTSASLRSRSYGQLTTTSPAFRPGPPSGNTLRHVKSTGHNLNSHYAGIRKSSLPQRSPLNLGSFGEAESLKRLMAQQVAAAASKTPLTTPLRTDFNHTPVPQDITGQLVTIDDKSTTALPSEILARYQNMQSPPQTPFQHEFMMQANSGSMPPPSARSQYASFVEYTPPYSAGPLTNSTWGSDAPLHSPDVTGFPSGHFMSPIAFSRQQESSSQPWILPSDGAVDMGLQQMELHDDNKKTEFFITEFPGQREEYASIAQHVFQPRPKNYVFANTAPSDYDG